MLPKTEALLNQYPALLAQIDKPRITYVVWYEFFDQDVDGFTYTGSQVYWTNDPHTPYLHNQSFRTRTTAMNFVNTFPAGTFVVYPSGNIGYL